MQRILIFILIEDFMAVDDSVILDSGIDGIVSTHVLNTSYLLLYTVLLHFPRQIS